MISLTKRLDGLAVALSGACLIHCLLLPVAAAFMPILVPAAEAEWVHWGFVAFAVPTSILALRHGDAGLIGTHVLRLGAGVGLLLLALGALGWPQPNYETAITVAGGLMLASVHLINFFRKKSNGNCVASHS